MALKASIYKVDLEIVDMDRHYYETHKLTLACHPSETEIRLMVRILAFALNAHERLEFGKGISDHDEPDLWQKDDTGAVDLWIELGHPDERVLKNACGRARKVLVYTYDASPDRWWDPIKNRLSRERNLFILALSAVSAEGLAEMADRSMNLQCTIQDGEIWFRDNQERAVQIQIAPLT